MLKKKFIIVLTLFSVMACTVLMPLSVLAEENEIYWPKGPSVTSDSAIVMEANTGAILYGKKIHTKHYPASITKILTTLLALENCDLTETVTFSQDAVFKTEGTSIARDVGEQMSLKDTLYAVMLGSANECAYATAEHVGGDLETFVEKMNRRAKEIGCEDSHFNNPHGLPDENHYTSAYDMALISREALKNDTFRAITGTKTYTIPKTNIHEEETYLVNHHAMLTYYHTGKYIYEDCIGGKTGYTNAAGNTLVTYAERNDMTLICVVMKSGGEDHYIDTTKLLDYCFDNYQMLNIAEHDPTYSMDKVESAMNFSSVTPYLSIDEDACIVLPKTADFSEVTSQVKTDNSREGIAGVIEYQYGGKVVGSTDILINENKVDEYSFDNEQIQETEGKKVFEISFGKILVVLVILLLLAGFVYSIIYVRRNIYIILYNIKRKRQRSRNEISFKGRRIKKRKLKPRKRH
ncbi:MAG: D-alanyl-D-alanine carboxypeptidase family protein [Lachnospiraceae bacterium]